MNIAATLPNSPIQLPTFTISKWRLRFLTLVAVGLVVMGILCNIIFYSEFGQGFSSLVYAIIGLLFDLSKVIIIGLFVIFLADFEKNLAEVTICIMTWFVLSLLSFGAAYGFLSQVNEKYEATRLKESNIYARHEAAVQTAQNKLDSLSQYAAIEIQALESQKKTLENSIGQWETKKAACPKNWFSKCINPAQSQFDSFQNKLSPLTTQLNGHTAYLSAIQHKESAVNALSQLDTGAINTYHPLFVNLGNVTHQEAGSVKGLFILLTSFVVELLASVLFYLKARLQNQAQPYRVYTQPQTSAYEQRQYAPSQTIELPAQKTMIDTDVYQQVVSDVQSKQLKNGSFRTLNAKYKLTQNQITTIRNQLVVDGLAILERRQELVFV
ncbi:MAG TPA: hypothetical protein EYP59_08240 [Thiotrichaceae bacterium]|nr:hypothetical protein [Thiotrichaceae bacterium]